MVFIGDSEDLKNVSQSGKDKKQDIKIDSLQNAIDEINSQITGIESNLQALQSAIADNYSAQTQTLLNTLNTKLTELSTAIETRFNTNEINATGGNFERLAATLTATISNLVTDILSVTNTADIKALQADTIETDDVNATLLNATSATIQNATINLLNVVSFTLNTLTAETITSEIINADSVFSDSVESEKIKVENISGKEWHTPISTPDNTELLKITIPRYKGVIQIQTMDNEFSMTILNGAVSYSEIGDYIYRIERTENAVNVYLYNIGDTINYRLLYIGSEAYSESTSEIVDKTDYQKNIETTENFLFFDDSGNVSASGDYQKKITGAASSITENNLAKNLVMVSDNDGKASVENVTRSELLTLQGITRNIQEQMNEKQDKILSHPLPLVNSTYNTVEQALFAIAGLLEGLLTDDIIYNGETEELIFPYNSIEWENEELTISGFTQTYTDEELYFSRY